MSIGKGIQLSSGFDLNSKSPLDNRTVFKTIEERDLLPDINLYEGLICYVESTKTNYQYIDGVWSRFAFGNSDNNGDINEEFRDLIFSELDKKSPIEHTHNSSNISYTTASDSNIKTIQDALDKLLYVPLSINLSSNRGTVEKGEIINSVIFNWSYNKSIVSQSFEGVVLNNFDRSYTYTTPFDTNKSFKLIANDGKTDFTKTVSINFANGRYWGVSNSEVFDSNLLSSLNKELVESKSKTFTVNCGAGQYIYFCIPSRLGTPIFKVGGFEGGFDKVSIINFNNKFNYVESYDIWKSTNDNLGNTTVVVS